MSAIVSKSSHEMRGIIDNIITNAINKSIPKKQSDMKLELLINPSQKNSVLEQQIQLNYISSETKAPVEAESDIIVEVTRHRNEESLIYLEEALDRNKHIESTLKFVQQQSSGNIFELFSGSLFYTQLIEPSIDDQQIDLNYAYGKILNITDVENKPIILYAQDIEDKIYKFDTIHTHHNSKVVIKDIPIPIKKQKLRKKAREPKKSNKRNKKKVTKKTPKAIKKVPKATKNHNSSSHLRWYHLYLTNRRKKSRKKKIKRIKSKISNSSKKTYQTNGKKSIKKKVRDENNTINQKVSIQDDFDCKSDDSDDFLDPVSLKQMQNNGDCYTCFDSKFIKKKK
eukprot:273528_1